MGPAQKNFSSGTSAAPINNNNMVSQLATKNVGRHERERVLTKFIKEKPRLTFANTLVPVT